LWFLKFGFYFSENLPLTPSLRGNYALQRYFYKNKIPILRPAIPVCVLQSPSLRGQGEVITISLSAIPPPCPPPKGELCTTKILL